DPRLEKWDKYIDLIAKRLMKESPLLFESWFDCFIARYGPISAKLGKIIVAPETKDSERPLAFSLLVFFSNADSNAVPVEWRIKFVLEVEDDVYEEHEELFFKYLSTPGAEDELNKELNKRLLLEGPEKDKETLAKRQARAVVALLQYHGRMLPLNAAER